MRSLQIIRIWDWEGLQQTELLVTKCPPSTTQTTNHHRLPALLLGSIFLLNLKQVKKDRKVSHSVNRCYMIFSICSSYPVKKIILKKIICLLVAFNVKHYPPQDSRGQSLEQLWNKLYKKLAISSLKWNIS